MKHDAGYIIIDTEGTGLFRHHNVGPDGEKVTARSDEPGQPRMAEFACVLADRYLTIEQEYQAYIMPDNWLNQDGSPLLEMPPAAFAVHGLSMEFLRERGIPAAIALDIYGKAIGDGRAVLGYNQQHDGRQVRAELRHIGLDDMFEITPTVCAMRSLQAAGIKVKKLNGKSGFPRLIDAAAHFGINYPEDRRHTALEDALVTRSVGRLLLDDGKLLEPQVHFAKSFQGREGGAAS